MIPFSERSSELGDLQHCKTYNMQFVDLLKELLKASTFKELKGKLGMVENTNLN